MSLTTLFKLNSLILVFLVGAACATIQAVMIALPRAEITNRDEAIQRFLGDRKLVPIEGVWIWDNNHYEVAIIPNPFDEFQEYEYVGILTDTLETGWKRGEVKLLLKETASSAIFTGIYFMGDKSRRGTSFILKNQNLIRTTIPTGPYGTQEELLIVRLYPKGPSPDAGISGGGVPTEVTGTGFFVSSEVTESVNDFETPVVRI